MLFDLLSTDMYVSYNVNLAHIIGLTAAIYLSELININRKAIDKDKLNDGFFNVDRKYIEKRTTLSDKEQKDLDKVLVEVGLINKGTKESHISVNMDALTGLLLEPNKRIVDKAVSIAKRSKPTKKEVIIQNLKLSVQTTNSELIEAYSNWIDSVYARQGWMSKEAVTEGEKLIDTFSGKDLDIALDVLKIASINGYRDISWAVEEYKKRNKSSYNGVGRIPNAPTITNSNSVKLSDEVF